MNVKRLLALFILIILTFCTITVFNNHNIFVPKTDRKIASIPHENSHKNCSDILLRFLRLREEQASLNFSSQMRDYEKFSILFKRLSHVFQNEGELSDKLNIITRELVSNLDVETVFKDEELLEFILVETQSLYSRSSDFERSLAYLNDIGLTDFVKKFIPETVQTKKRGYFYDSFLYKAVSTKLERAIQNPTGLDEKILYHATNSREVWESIKSRKDGNLNALITHSGPGSGFYFTDSMPKKQYGNYIIAFRIRDSSIFRFGDKPHEFILTNAHGTKVVPFVESSEFKYAEWDINQLFDKLASTPEIKIKETGSAALFYKKIQQSFSIMPVNEQRNLILGVLSNLNDSNASVALKSLSELKLNREQVKYLVEKSIELNIIYKKEVPLYFDFSVLPLELNKVFMSGEMIRSYKIGESSTPRNYKNLSYWVINFHDSVDINHFYNDSFNFSTFLHEALKGMTKSQRLVYSLEHVDRYANRVADVVLSRPFVLSNQGVVELFKKYIFLGKDVHLTLPFLYNPQLWSIQELGQVIKGTHIVKRIKSESEIFSFDTPLKGVLDEIIL
jgi:hypothetical protein